jgi:hypothetical protein
MMFTREQTVQAIGVLEDLLNYPTLLGESGLCLYTSEALRDRYHWSYEDRGRLSTLIESLIPTVPLEQEVPSCITEESHPYKEPPTVTHYPWISPRGQWTTARKQLALNVIQELRNLYIGS